MSIRVRPRWLAGADVGGAGIADPSVAFVRLARACVPKAADYCSIDLVVDGGIRQVAWAARDGEGGGSGVRATPAAGQCLLGAVLAGAGATIASPEGLGSAVECDAVAAQRLAGLPTGAMIVPIALRRGAVAGAITLLLERGGDGYDEESLADALDVAAQAGLLIEAARLATAARSATRARSEFLAIVSHELRTPLNIILGYTELMVNGIPETLGAESARQVERIRASARYLLQRIEEVLTYTRLEGGRETVRAERLDVAALVREVAELIAPLADARRLEFQVPEPPVLEITSDAAHLRQILLHLLSNAVRFTDRGSVHLSVSQAGGKVHFEVRDTGRGMTDAERSRIFEPFWQADPLATRRAQGAGLGLSIALRLARLLGGGIRCQSEPGRGSTFVLTVPTRPAA